MFGTLFLKECKQVLHSLVYYIYLAIFVLFMVSQLGGNEIVSKPTTGQEFYGTKVTTDEHEIMGATLGKLVNAVNWNSFATYPTGFYRGVTLSDEELDTLKDIIDNCTQKSWDQIMEESKEYYEQFDTSDYEQSYLADAGYRVDAAQEVTYDYFAEEMEKVCDIVGAGSDYEKATYESSVSVPMTYEDAMEEYQAVVNEDGITGAYMRLYCDYAGIVLALLPIFLGVTRCVRDKRAKAEGVIYARNASSFTIVASRYVANAVMIFLPVVLLAFATQASYIYQAHTLDVQPQIMAFLWYSVIWLLPTLLFILAVSFFLTELTNGVIATIIMVFCVIAADMSVTNLVGNFGWRLIPRWNTFGMTMNYMAQRSTLYQNRILYTGLAIVVFALAVVVYNYKRKGGRLLHGKKH